MTPNEDPWSPAAFAAGLATARVEHRYRQRATIAAAAGTDIIINGQRCTNFSSNDYLGLAKHPDVIAAFCRGAETYGVGSGASHLVTGHTHAHQALEEALAEFTGRPRALLFSTGWMANTGVLTALLGQRDTLIADRLNHASLIDGGLASGAQLRRYRHADTEHCTQLLKKNVLGRQLIVTDGVFSMDGDVAPLTTLTATAHAHRAWLMVDDAHGFGVLGRAGRGSVDAANLSLHDVPILMGTLGKAFGTFGAFVAGSDELIDTLIQHTRSYIYTTALPPAVAAASLASLHLLRNGEERRDILRAHIARFRAAATDMGYRLLASDTPIQPILVGDSQDALAFSAALREHNLVVTAIRPPTVPAGSARLRFTFSAAHSTEQIDNLLAALATLAPRFAGSAVGDMQ